MSNSVSKELSRCFQLASIIATILVISIHYQSKYYIQGDDNWNYILQEFLTNGIARVAVPFFALSSGFFFFLKYSDLSTYKTNIKKRIFTIVIPYMICSLFMFSTQYFYITVLKGLSYPLDFNIFIHNVFIVPVSVQLWFLRDLMFLFLISPLLFLLIRHCVALGLIFLSVLWFAEIQIMPTLGGKYIISIETLFFFYSGAFLVTKTQQIDRVLKLVTKSAKVSVTMLLFFLVFLRIWIDPTFSLGYQDYNYGVASLLIYKVYIALGIVVLVVVSYGKNFNGLSYIASFTFFAYLYHLLPLSYVVTKLGHFLLPNAYVFYFNFPAAVALTFFAAYSLNKLLPKLYSVLAGGRVS